MVGPAVLCRPLPLLPSKARSGLRALPLLVTPILDFATVGPPKNNALGIDDDEFAGDKSWTLEFALGDLAFTAARAQVGAPSDRAGGDVLIAGNLHRFEFFPLLGDSDNLVKMARIMANPFAGVTNRIYHQIQITAAWLLGK